MKYILVLILSVSLQGCGFLNYFKNKDPVLPPEAIATIHEDALKQCINLKENILITSLEDSLVVYGDLATAYGICAKQQSNSIKLIKQLGNIK